MGAPHHPRNINLVHAEHMASTFNNRVATLLTNGVGTMWCAYLFACLALAGFPPQGSPPSAYVAWTSQTLIQLTMLSVIMVSQNIQAQKQALLADEQYQTTIKMYTDIEEIKSILVDLRKQKRGNLMSSIVPARDDENTEQPEITTQSSSALFGDNQFTHVANSQTTVPLPITEEPTMVMPTQPAEMTGDSILDHLLTLLGDQFYVSSRTVTSIGDDTYICKVAVVGDTMVTVGAKVSGALLKLL